MALRRRRRWRSSTPITAAFTRYAVSPASPTAGRPLVQPSQCWPTAAGVRQSMQAGRPQAVQESAVSTFGWNTQVVAAVVIVRVIGRATRT